MQDRLVASMPEQAIGFAEKYDADWQPLANFDRTTMQDVDRLRELGHADRGALGYINNFLFLPPGHAQGTH